MSQENTAPNASAVGPFVGVRAMIRCRDAGVHFGVVVAIADRTVSLKDARRIWSWSGAYTLSDLSRGGPALDASGTRIGPVLDSIALLEACEIIPLTEDGAKRLDAVPEWQIK